MVDAQDVVSLVSMCAGVAGLGYLLRWRARTALHAVQGIEGAVAPSSSAPSSSSSLETTTTTTPPKASEGGISISSTPFTAMARVEYEEDHEVDPTKVGASVASTSKPTVAAVAATAATTNETTAAPASSSPPSSSSLTVPPLQRIVYDEEANADEPTHADSLFLVSATSQTDPGKRRKRNEDSLLVLEEENLYVVADGMGGYRGGALASQLAVRTIKTAFRDRSFDRARETRRTDIPRQAKELGCAMQLANEAILETAEREGLEGMGTTLVAARFSPTKRRLYIGHVGDSRCYRLRDGQFTQMTADHTMADFGITGPESAQLSRAVGIWPTVPIDIVMATPMAGDVYLLCSDGLNKMLSDETIAAVLRYEEDPKVAVERLIFFANAHGGKDNTTVILVRVVPPDWKPTTTTPTAPTRTLSERPPPQTHAASV